jgi:Uncharacterized protein conserved in bacteria (DUF2219)
MRAVILMCLLVAAAASPSSARADDTDRPLGSTVNGRFSIEESNDKFAWFGGSDSQFTQGLKIRATWGPRWDETLLGKFLYERYRKVFRPHRITASIELGQSIFTPENISPFREDDELEPGEAPLTTEQKEAEFDAWYRTDFPRDRPYSAELYTEYRINGFFARPTLASYLTGALGEVGLVRWSLAARAGYVGPKFAGQVQKAVHVLMRGLDGEALPRDPQGWEFQQRENGFQPIRDTEIASTIGVNASAELEWDIANVAFLRYFPHLRISGLINAELGQFRDLGGLGLTVEFGRLGRNPLACFPEGKTQLIPPDCPAAGGPQVGGDYSSWAIYAFTTARGRAILYDRHLDNRIFRDDAVEADRRFRDADLTFGAVARLWSFELELSHMVHVKETKERELGRFHHVGTFKLTALF